MAVSLPTHVTGYYLEELQFTVMVWCAVTTGFAYAVLATIAFFEVMANAINESYGSGTGELGKRSKLAVVHAMMPVSRSLRQTVPRR